jgi:hypothetical protein
MATNFVLQFWRHCSLADDGPDTCWIWHGAQRDDGRGRMRVRGKEITAHRAAWEIRHGEPAPQGYRLVQTCAHPNCVRHWRLGERCPKLSPSDKASIRHSLMPHRALARKYRVSHSLIIRIRQCTVLPA